VTSALQGYNQQVSDLGNRPATDYVAPLSGLQNQAITGAGNLGGWQDMYTKASGLLSGDDYGNPYTEGVINSSLAGYDDQAGRTAAGNAAAAAKNNAFGGSRYGILESQQQQDSNLGRAKLESGLRSDAYDKGVTNKLNTAGLLGSLGSSLGAGQRADIDEQLKAGGLQQQQDQQQRTADITLAQIMGSLYGQGQYGLFQGANSTGKTVNSESPTKAEQVGQAINVASSLAALFSDIRLKRDIKPLDVRNGRQWYSYRYIWSDDLHEGIMAHENPDVAILDPSGFLKVDYGAL
jgi:hypothetical protein